ncbi:MAG TPA: hypothetical protein VK430_06445 [Xanthobacteraceae bacterium]|nr:hypothetical protein [Xanthobacteraceae bacterium]
MGRKGEKQKRKPKLKDKRQSERFRRMAEKVEATQPSNFFDRVIGELGRQIRERKEDSDN